MNDTGIPEARECVIRDAYRLVGKLLAQEAAGRPLHPLGEPDRLWRAQRPDGGDGHPLEYVALVESLASLDEAIEAEFERRER